MTASHPPSLSLERRLMRAGAGCAVGVDEVGRGALAGPVTVGAVLVRPQTRSAPKGVRDSKELTPAERERLAPLIRRWAPASGVGHATPEEIDEHGIIAALRLAAVRALVQLGGPVGAVILDGSHDWLGGGRGRIAEFPEAGPLLTRVKADRTCAAVAAASVIAKVARDALMTSAHERIGRYGWDSNKGYAAPEHLAALGAHGPCREHRLSWQLPGVDPEALARIDPGRRRFRSRTDPGEQLVLIEDRTADLRPAAEPVRA